MTPYTEVDPLGPTPSGDVAGYAQLSTAWGRRFAADLGDGRWDVCDVDLFVVDADHLDDTKPTRPVIELRVAHTLCTDPADPIGTELAVTPVDSDELPDPDATEHRARELCAAFDPARITAPTWPTAPLR